MSDTLFARKYLVLRILEPSKYINYYVGETKDMEKSISVIINEIFDRDIINFYLTDFLLMKQNKKLPDFIDCFTEDSKLYVVFSYRKGRNITKFLKEEKLRKEYRIVLLKNIMQKFLEYGFCPAILRKSILSPQNLMVDEGAVYFNYCLCPNTNKEVIDEDSIFKSIGNIINDIFKKDELANEKKLSIILEKCEKGLYLSMGELIKDLEDLSGAIEKEESLKTIILEKKKKFEKYILRAFVLCIVFGVAFVLYENYISKSTSAFLYKDVEQIGTVNVNKNSGFDGERENISVRVTEKEEDRELETNNIFNETNVSTTEQKVVTDEEKDQDKALGTEKYEVKENDTLYAICLKAYKDIKYIDALAKYNNISADDTIYPGDFIDIPEKENLDKLLE